MGDADLLIPLETDQAVRAYHPDVAEQWLGAPPDLVARYCNQWRLRLGRRLTRGEGSWKAQVWTASGPALLKVAVPGTHAAEAVIALSHWDGRGAIRLLESDTAHGVMLVEWCTPATTPMALPPTQNDEVGIAVLRELAVLPPVTPLESLADRLRPVADIIESRFAVTRPPIDQWIVDVAVDTFRHLPGSANHAVLLHGDFGWLNVLLSERGWLAVDPEPCCGDAAFDVAHYLGEFRDADDIRARLGRYTLELGLDAARVAAYLLAQTVRGLSWWVQAGEDEETLRSAARANAVAAAYRDI